MTDDQQPFLCENAEYMLDGLLPLRPWSEAEADYAEERRLLFVGMTRATTRLILTGADKHVIRGEARESLP
jgi:superfamily I DNA/RNA helicase